MASSVVLEEYMSTQLTCQHTLTVVAVEALAAAESLAAPFVEEALDDTAPVRCFPAELVHKLRAAAHNHLGRTCF